MATFLIAGSFRITGALPDGDSIRFRFGAGGQAFTSSTLRHQQTVVARALLDVLVIDHPGSPGSATRRAGSSAEDTVRGMMGGG
jgi:hypothetical protein